MPVTHNRKIHEAVGPVERNTSLHQHNDEKIIILFLWWLGQGPNIIDM